MLFHIFIAFALLSVALAQDDAARDVALGLQGLIEASKDPAALAQLMQDLQVRENVHYYVLHQLTVSFSSSGS